jgi:hypothetical protein
MKYLYVILAILTAINFRAVPARKLFTKTPIKPKIFREWVGYSTSAGDISKMQGFFNFFGQVDPLNGVTAIPNGISLDTIFGFPRHMYDSYYKQGTVNGNNYPGNRGLNIVFDFSGAKDMNDTTHTVNITDLWGWNATFDAGDTLYFYNLDVMFRVAYNLRSWYLARPDSMMTAFAKIVTTVNPTAPGAWVSTTCNINCRYLMIRAVKKDRTSYFTIPDFAELSIYGTYNYDTTALDKRPGTYTGATPRANTYGEFTGTNLGNGIDTLASAYDGMVRIYGDHGYWDTTRSQTTTAAATFTLDYFSDIGPTQYPFYKRTNKKFWWSIRGNSNYLNQTHPGSYANTDNWGGETESYNFTRDSKFFGWYGLQWQSIISYVENGNEDNYTVSGLCYFLRTSMNWDSLRVYSSTMKLVMSGTTEFDSLWVDNFVWFSRILRADHVIPVNAFNFHHYPRSVNYLGYGPSTAQQVGGYGRSPEGDNIIGLAATYIAYSRAVYNYTDGDTSFAIYCTEQGYGNYGTASIDATQASYPWDLGCSPGHGSFDSLRYKAIMMARCELIMNETPVVGYNEFNMMNEFASTTNYPNLFKSYGRINDRDNGPPFALHAPTPWWYYRASIYNRLKWYRLVSATGTADTTGLHHQYWQKVDSATGRLTDSICDIVWKNSQQAASASNQTVRIGYRKNSLVEKYVPSFTAVMGTSSTAPVLLNSLFLTSQDEQPTFFFGKSGALLWVTPFSAIKLTN